MLDEIAEARRLIEGTRRLNPDGSITVPLGKPVKVELQSVAELTFVPPKGKQWSKLNPLKFMAGDGAAQFRAIQVLGSIPPSSINQLKGRDLSRIAMALLPFFEGALAVDEETVENNAISVGEDGSVTVPLASPVETNGKKVTALTFVEPTGEHWPLLNAFHISAGDGAAHMQAIQVLGNVDKAVADLLDGADIARIVKRVLLPFLDDSLPTGGSASDTSAPSSAGDAATSTV